MEPSKKLGYEQSQRYIVLQVSLAGMIFATLVLGAINLNPGADHFAWVMFTSSAICILGIFVNRMGNYTLAGILFILDLLSIMIFNIIDRSGFDSLAIVAFPVLIILSAYILGKPGLIAALFGSIASLGVLRLLNQTGLVSLGGNASPDQVMAITVNLLVTSGVVWIILSAWEKSLAERVRSERRYRSLFEDSPVALWEADASALKNYVTGLVRTGVKDLHSYFAGNPDRVQQCVSLLKSLDLNQGMLELLGSPSREELSGNILARFSESTLSVFLEAFLTLLQGERYFEAEMPLKKLDGVKIVTNLRLSIPHGFEEDWARVQISLTNITQPKQAEEAIRKSEEKFSKVFHSTSAIMALFTLDGDRFIDVNDTFLKEFGYERDEVVGHTASELGIWEDSARRPEFFDGSGTAQDISIRDVTLRAKDAHLINVYASFRVVLIGAEPCVLATGVDITEQKLTEDKLRSEMARSSALARTAARLNTQLDLDRVLESICEEIVTVMQVPAAAILLDDPRQGQANMRAAHGLPRDFVAQFVPIPRERYAKNGQPVHEAVVFSSIQNHPEIVNADLYALFNIHTLLWIGIFHQEQFLGVIDVYFYEENRTVSESEISLLKTLTELGAQAISNSHLFREVMESREHLQQVSQQLIEVQEAERRALALELHDELGQVLNGIKISLDMIPILPNLATRDQMVDRARSATGSLIERVRQMSLNLRPSLLDEMGLRATLTWFFRNYQEQTGSPIEFHWLGTEQRFSPPVEITAYRIVQEALNNTIRHASKKQAAVTVWTDDCFLHLSVEDKGGGFDVEKALTVGKSTGLSGMRERARMLGGELLIESTPGAGTAVSASLPLVGMGAKLQGGERVI